MSNLVLDISASDQLRLVLTVIDSDFLFLLSFLNVFPFNLLIQCYC